MSKKLPLPVTTGDYKERLNTKIRAQDDFFEHVNSNWLKTNPIPPTEAVWGTFYAMRDQSLLAMRDIYEQLQNLKDASAGSIEQQARDFYYTGMNMDKLEATHLDLVNKQFEQIDSVATTDDLARVIGELQAIGVSGPWRVGLDADDKDSKVHILRFMQGGLSLPDRDYYIDSGSKRMQEVRKAYKAHLKKVHKHFPKLSKSAVLFEKTIFDFEKQLAAIARTKIELRDIEKNYNKTPYAKVQKTYAAINWPAYATAFGWEADDKICIDQPEFMAFINKQFKMLPLDSWKTYLKWQFLRPYYGCISERYAELKFEFFGKVLSGTKEILPRWKRVGAFIDNAIGEGVGKLYAKKHFPESAKKQVLTMVERLRKVYMRRITKLEWMEEPSKKEALKKLAGFKVLIGYPDKWRDFSKLKIDRTSYLGNIIAAELFNNAYELGRLHKPVSRDEWHMYPQTVNAYHDFNRAVVCFPAGILQTPFFNPKAPDAVNYGAIGAVIGHELTHGFDDQGCQFDSAGNARTWQTKKDQKEFKKRAKLIIDQADKFEVLPGLFMKGNLVIGEAIADLGGLEIAYEAMKMLKLPAVKVGEPTNDQLFFTGFAVGECGATRDETRRERTLTDPHADPRFRANGTVAHIDAFYKTFNVQQGDKLYRDPKQRAKIW